MQTEGVIREFQWSGLVLMWWYGANLLCMCVCVWADDTPFDQNSKKSCTLKATTYEFPQSTHINVIRTTTKVETHRAQRLRRWRNSGITNMADTHTHTSLSFSSVKRPTVTSTSHLIDQWHTHTSENINITVFLTKYHNIKTSTYTVWWLFTCNYFWCI